MKEQDTEIEKKEVQSENKSNVINYVILGVIALLLWYYFYGNKKQIVALGL
jgi:hypothetical protein